MGSAITQTRLIVGMEVHVELSTRTKMFSRAPNVAHPDFYDAPPNSLCDPVSLGLPGALPTMNHDAIEMSMLVGMAIGCRIPDQCSWDRKNYFYPDLPKGYQISQYEHPLCAEGCIDIPLAAGGTGPIRITRAHLEEDTGKSSHDLPGGQRCDGSIIDYNRSGTPLLEIVTEPDITCADDAVTFGRELRSICRALGVTEGIMQRGHMRFEPNINMAITLEDGREVRTPIAEIKNLNSFRAVHGAIEHEADRQVNQWLEDGIEMGPGAKSTRGWDDEKCVTILQRSKEDAHDYRYFPEPDLVPLQVDQAWRDRVRAQLPELPMQRRARYESAWGLSAKDAAALTESPETAIWFDACACAAASESEFDEATAAQEAAKWSLNAAARIAGANGVEAHACGVSPEQLGGLIGLRASGDVGSSAATTIFEAMCTSDQSARELAEANNLLQVSDAGALDGWIDEALSSQPQAAEDFAAGKDAAAGRIIGHVMKASGGAADAAGVRARLVERLR
jgi:aspartyl-tRNA(Asn)/glutamyl-tRNA(Gln) amidotransferase subunit B